MTEEEKKELITGAKGAVIAFAAIAIIGAAFSYVNKNSGVTPAANTATVIATNQQVSQQQAPQPKQPATTNEINIGVLNYDIVMGGHPLLIEAQTISEQKINEVREKIQNLPEVEQIEAWRKFEQETMTEIQENYVDKAKKEVDDAIDEVIEKKGITMLFTSNQLLRGGVDVTKDVQEALKK